VWPLSSVQTQAIDRGILRLTMMSIGNLATTSRLLSLLASFGKLRRSPAATFLLLAGV